MFHCIYAGAPSGLLNCELNGSENFMIGKLVGRSWAIEGFWCVPLPLQWASCLQLPVEAGLVELRVIPLHGKTFMAHKKGLLDTKTTFVMHATTRDGDNVVQTGPYF